MMALLLWVLFRNMFGAGMIKVRGDDCWRDLTCLNTHFETQPLPNLLSPWFHRLPQWMLKGGVLFNHVVELLAPFGLLLTAPFRIVAGILTAIFQIILIISGNLSWLNWLTLVLCIPCFDDRIWRRMIPQQWLPTIPTDMGFSVLATGTQWGLIGLGVLVAVLSIQPIQNLLSSQQRMNTSYDPFHLVNSYGAFGSVGKERFECVIKAAMTPAAMIGRIRISSQTWASHAPTPHHRPLSTTARLANLVCGHGQYKPQPLVGALGGQTVKK